MTGASAQTQASAARTPPFLARLDWALPVWALVCGVLSAGRLPSQAEAPQLALGALAICAWQAVSLGLRSIELVSSVRRWRQWTGGNPMRPLPYTEHGSPGDRAATLGGEFFAWIRADLWPRHSLALAAVPAALAVLALVLPASSAVAAMLALLALAAGQLSAALWVFPRHAWLAQLCMAIAAFSAPMLLGGSLLMPVTLSGIVTALAGAALVAGMRAPGAGLLGLYAGWGMLAAGALARGQPGAALMVALLWLPVYARGRAAGLVWPLLAVLVVAAIST